MTIKKFLTTPEEILSLKDTDTKIYSEGVNGYYQFVRGALCYFYEDGSIIVYGEIGMGKGFSNKYILVEEPVKEADENDIGKLCWFWDDDEDDKTLDILKDTSIGPRHFEGKATRWYYNCSRLTPDEVAEMTGYKVE